MKRSGAYSERVGPHASRKINLRANILVNLSGIILYQISYQVLIFLKSIFRSVIVFRDVIVNQVVFQHELYNVRGTRAERLENLFSNVFVRDV